MNYTFTKQNYIIHIPAYGNCSQKKLKTPKHFRSIFSVKSILTFPKHEN